MYLMENTKAHEKNIMNPIVRVCLLTLIFIARSCYAASFNDEGRPHEHYCPITSLAIRDPV